MKKCLRDKFHRNRKMKLSAAWGCLLLLTNISQGQSYSINWYKVSGGGGTSTGGVYQVNGTIGQHDAGGPMTGGAYSVTGGFWSLVAPVQTPGAPTLYINQAGKTVTVYWQAVSGWSLHQDPKLADTNGWSASTGITTSGGTNYLTMPAPAGQLFFRLMNP